MVPGRLVDGAHVAAEVAALISVDAVLVHAVEEVHLAEADAPFVVLQHVAALHGGHRAEEEAGA